MLKDSTETSDHRLGRLVQFDPRSRNYPVRALLEEKKRRSYTWRCHEFLDQGREGSCVGHGICHELAARPSEVSGLTTEYAKEKIYWEAQKIDPWDGGSYPGASPFYEGTSVLAGVKVAQSLGHFGSYRWAFGLEDLILGVGYNGPAVLGVAWYEGMFDTDDDGYLSVSGRVAGGHCILCNAVDVRRERFTLHNSWGRGWGRNGVGYVSFSDMDKLLKNRGEAVFFLDRVTQPIPV